MPARVSPECLPWATGQVHQVLCRMLGAFPDWWAALLAAAGAICAAPAGGRPVGLGGEVCPMRT